MTIETGTLNDIRTKLQRLGLAGDPIPKLRPLDRLRKKRVHRSAGTNFPTVPFCFSKLGNV